MSLPTGFIKYYTNALKNIEDLVYTLCLTLDCEDVSRQKTIDSINKNIEILKDFIVDERLIYN